MVNLYNASGVQEGSVLFNIYIYDLTEYNFNIDTELNGGSFNITEGFGEDGGLGGEILNSLILGNTAVEKDLGI